MNDGDARQDRADGAAEGAPERLYVITEGRSRPSDRVAFDLVTLIVARSKPKPGMHPEQLAILRMCATPLSVAEVSAYLSLPVSTVTVLVADLLEIGQVEARAPMPVTDRSNTALLEMVIDGLSKL